MARVLIDTGVWYSRYDPRDTAASQDDVEAVFELVQAFDIVLPWPIAYETLRTRFTRNRIAMTLFEEELKSPSVQFIDDAPYRGDAIELAFVSSRAGRPLSMVDCVLRLIMDDRNVNIGYFATWNLRDFCDVCAIRRIETIPN